MISQDRLIELGFRFGKNGAHSARSMMIEELKLLFSGLPENAERARYEQDILDYNILHKASQNARKLTFRHLVGLYGMSPEVPLFRVFRQLWELSEEAQPVLALQLAVARDPLLRNSVPVILGLHEGEYFSRQTIEEYLAHDDPDRFSPASLKSFAQNINGTWTQAGYLAGRVKKYRSIPTVTYVNVVFALYLAHCNGLSGQRMMQSQWCKLLACDMSRIEQLAHAASLRGLINFKQASEVVEVSFTGLNL